MLSIFCMVYNHEPFLKQCLDGFVMQKCEFEFEIVIGEDCSTDRSREIILDYAYRYPGKFKLLLHNKNIGAEENQRLVLENCIGKYIALCEGDDYWTDPNKLQKQIDLLEQNHKASMVFSNCNVDINGDINEINLNYPNYFTFIKYLQLYNAIPTCTMVFRRSCFTLDNKTIELLQNCPVGDFPMRFLIGDKGDFIFISESTAVYRKHDGGISNNFHHSNHYLGILRMYKELNTYFNYKYDYFLGIHLQDTYERLFYTYCKDKVFFAAFKTFFKACIDFDGKYLKFNRCLNIFKHGVKEFILK